MRDRQATTNSRTHPAPAHAPAPEAAAPQPAALTDSMDSAAILRLQGVIGNQAVGALFAQRQEADAQPGTADPATSPVLTNILSKPSHAQEVTPMGHPFHAEYLPNNGNPTDQRPLAGSLIITLRLHITFRSFTAVRNQEPYKSMRFSKAQIKDFEWKPEEETEFKTNIIPAIQQGWETTRRLTCTTAGCEELNAGVQVKVQLVDDASQAHNRVTAQKVPAGAPRFRSNVRGDTSVLDRLDPTQKRNLEVHEIHHRTGPFDNNSHDTTPVQGDIDEFIRQYEALPERDSNADNFSPYTVKFVGRATSVGSKKHNEKLGLERATNAMQYFSSKTSRADFFAFATSDGETGTTNDEEFRRVDMYVVAKPPPGQMTAAHEAGHMFGLGDEYEDPKDDDDPSGRGRFYGDKPSHHDEAEAELDTAAADETLVGDNESIMSAGMEILPAHLTPFIMAIETLTGGLQWTVQR